MPHFLQPPNFCQAILEKLKLSSSNHNRKLNIFVHRASECLTDHESHGEGLICFSLLKGLAERGHHIYAYTNHAAIKEMPPRMQVKAHRHQVPANSLAPWEHTWRASRWLKKLMNEVQFDLVWHMNPAGGSGCPRPPQTFGKPLVVGPLYYGWPKQAGGLPASGQPRLGIGLQSIVGPVAERGWQKTLAKCHTVFCATRTHAEALQRQLPGICVTDLPLIVDPPPGLATRVGLADSKRVTLLFVANLVPNKNPLVFCETILHLRSAGIHATGIVLGDGTERKRLEEYCAAQDLTSSICFRGKVANSEVYGMLREADFLVSASLGEPYGRGIAEAMSVGTPAVCHRSGGPADFIEDGQNGLLVDELTGAAYAGRIQQALGESGAWQQLSANALSSAANWRRDVVLSALEKALYMASLAGPREN